MRIRLWLLGLAGVIAFGGLLYYLTTLGPRRVGSSVNTEKILDDAVVIKLSDEIGRLENGYRQAASANLVTPAVIDALAQALDKQRELIRIYPRAGKDQTTRLMRLEADLASARAREKMVQIDRLEREGEDMLSGPDPDRAFEKLKEALRLQREINSSAASAVYKNYVRETSMAQTLSAVEAAPLKKELDGFIAEARKATAQQRWSDALAAYTSARDLQARINREYGRTRFSNLTGEDNLDAEIESLNAAGIIADIDAKEKAGDMAMAEKRMAEAAVCFEQAGALQLKVNQTFRRSRFVSSQRIENLEVKRQTALSHDIADALDVLNRTIEEHLKKRQVVAAEGKIQEAVAMVNKLFAEHPKSPRLDGALKIKMTYLSLRLADLRKLQDKVYDGLLPLPGAPDRLLLKTEVPQSLYVLVMNINPSRNPGRAFPVDSVNWNDAQEFCTRLSWLLGTPVRLPSVDELRVAMGDGNSGAWSQQNSEGHSHEVGLQPPNDAGFYDLAGNLSEWTSTESASDKALVAGGSYLDTPGSLAKTPRESRYKSDRARHVGFRFVVELPSP